MRRILVLGRSGQVARELARAPVPAGTLVECRGRDIINVAKSDVVASAIAALHPAVVVNAAAYTDVDRAERDEVAAYAVNGFGAANVAEACAEQGVPLVHLSTDYVFDGETERGYSELAATAPLNVYGRSKLAGEIAVRRSGVNHVILRTAAVFSPFGGNIVRRVLARARDGEPLMGLADRRLCPTSARDIARAAVTVALRLVTSGTEASTLHFCGQPSATALELVEEIARLGAEAGLFARPPVRPVAIADWHEAAARPRNAALDCARIASLWSIAPRPWRAELADCVAEIAAGRSEAQERVA